MKLFLGVFLLATLMIHSKVSLAFQTSTTTTPTACYSEKESSLDQHPLWMHIIGWSATGLGFLSSLPAIYHVYKVKDVGGLSPVAFTVGTITVLLGAIYNLALKNPILIAGSGWGLVCNGLFFFAMYKFRKKENPAIQLVDLPESV